MVAFIRFSKIFTRHTTAKYIPFGLFPWIRIRLGLIDFRVLQYFSKHFRERWAPLSWELRLFTFARSVVLHFTLRITFRLDGTKIQRQHILLFTFRLWVEVAIMSRSKRCQSKARVSNSFGRTMDATSLRSPLWQSLDDNETFFHNLSSKTLTKAQNQLLNLGYNFVFAPEVNSTTIDEFCKNIAQFKRSIKIREQFRDSQDRMDEFYVPNPDYEPTMTPSKELLHYFNQLDVMAHRFSEQDHSFYQKMQAPPSQISQALSELRADPEIIIREADKKLGLVVMDKIWYDAQVNSHLLVASNYELFKTLDPDSSDEASSVEANTALRSLDLFQHLRSLLEEFNLLTFGSDRSLTRIAKFILQDQGSPQHFCKFYILPKIHKTPASSRPICSNLNFPTYFASKYVDIRLQILVSKTPAFLKNSKNLIQRFERMQCPDDAVLMSADIVSLYPSIPISDAIAALRHLIDIYHGPEEDFRNAPRPHGIPSHEIDFLIKVTEFILLNCYLRSGNSVRRQISGLAMGTPCAVVVSNIFMASLEYKMTLRVYNTPALPVPPLAYWRFIDDILSVVDSVASGLKLRDAINSMHPKIKIDEATFALSPLSVNFLDITIFKRSQHHELTPLSPAIFHHHLHPAFPTSLPPSFIPMPPPANRKRPPPYTSRWDIPCPYFQIPTSSYNSPPLSFSFSILSFSCSSFSFVILPLF